MLGPEPRDKTIKQLGDFFAAHPWRNPNELMDLQSIRQKLVFDEMAEEPQGQAQAPALALAEEKVKTEEKNSVKTESPSRSRTPAVANVSPELLAAIVIDSEDDEPEQPEQLEDSCAKEPAAW